MVTVFRFAVLAELDLLLALSGADIDIVLVEIGPPFAVRRELTAGAVLLGLRFLGRFPGAINPLPSKFTR